MVHLRGSQSSDDEMDGSHSSGSQDSCVDGVQKINLKENPAYKLAVHREEDDRSTATAASSQSGSQPSALPGTPRAADDATGNGGIIVSKKRPLGTLSCSRCPKKELLARELLLFGMHDVTIQEKLDLQDNNWLQPVWGHCYECSDFEGDPKKFEKLCLHLWLVRSKAATQQKEMLNVLVGGVQVSKQNGRVRLYAKASEDIARIFPGRLSCKQRRALVLTRIEELATEWVAGLLQESKIAQQARADASRAFLQKATAVANVNGLDVKGVSINIQKLSYKDACRVCESVPRPCTHFCTRDTSWVPGLRGGVMHETTF